MNIFGYILIALLCAPYYIAILSLILNVANYYERRK